MPRYFLNEGLEMQMPNETFDLLWNNCLNAELTDSETSSSFGEGDKVTSSVEKKNKQKVLDGESRTTDTTTTSRTTTITSRSITKRRRNRAVYATYAVQYSKL